MLLRRQRRNLPQEFRKIASQAIVHKLLAHDCYQGARTVHCYVAWQEEVENHDLLRAILRDGKKVVAPKVNTQIKELENYVIPYFDALAPGAFGIFEPDAERGACRFTKLEELDLIIVPGLAFDRQGNRLGYGGGYYDRLLAEIRAPKVALAFAAQIVDAIPTEKHDHGVDFIVTEQEVISCRVR